MRVEVSSIPSFRNGIWQVWHRNFLQFRRSWLANLFWIILEPLMFLIAIGYGLGSFVSTIGGVSYIEFFFPALLCTSSMMVSFFDSTYGNFSKLTYQKIYRVMMMTPLDARQIVLGEIIWGACKGTFSAFGVALVAGLFGHVNSWGILPAFVVIFASSFFFSALGMIVTSIVKNYDSIIYPSSGLIIPMSLFSGTYFPIENLPFVLKSVTYLLPLTHSVVAVRGLLLGVGSWWQVLAHATIITLIAAYATVVAIRRIEKRLWV